MVGIKGTSINHCSDLKNALSNLERQMLVVKQFEGNGRRVVFRCSIVRRRLSSLVV